MRSMKRLYVLRYFGLLLGNLLPLLACSQTAQPPSYFGARPGLIVDFRQPEKSTFNPPLRMATPKQALRTRGDVPLTRKCATVEMEKKRQIQNAGATESTQTFEGWIDKRLDEKTRSRSGRREELKVYTIPTVVHIIYSNPGQNISGQQVLSQLEVLNEDYRRRNPNNRSVPAAFQGIATDTHIEFCLAQRDPQGRPTNGIHRVSQGGSPFTEETINNLIKPQTSWDPNRYFNIWVCDIADGILGFAQFPHSAQVQGIPTGSTAAHTDGVVINYKAFGTVGTVSSPFNGGRTATHEVGHWLGLRHIWGDGNCSVDDFCEDTPPTDGAHFNCPNTGTACDGQRAMVSNFMDYTDDACMNLFTEDQMARMRMVLENSPRRKSLLNSNACQPPITPPQPAFAASIRTGCEPLEVQFINQSKGESLSYQWQFEGGRPSSSTEANPTVSYRRPGRFPVTLTATNAAGTRIIREAEYIEVMAAGVALPFVADFEAGPFPPQGLTLYNPQNDYPWQRDPRVSGNGQGSASLTINNFDNRQRGSLDWLLTPVMDFSGKKEVQLSFKVAYAPYNRSYSDTLGVFIATDCGSSFRNIYLRGGERLSTTEASTMAFRPEAEQWRTEVIDLSQWAGQSHVQLAFVNRAGYGNYLYLDDIQVETKRAPAPQPAFRASARSVCPGDTVRFEDNSAPNPQHWVWSFPGGTPASDTLRRPYVRYTQPGRYPVTLTVSNEGGSQSLTQEGFIEVKPQPRLSLTASDTDVCLGESVTLKVEAESDYQWSLGPGITPPRGDQVKFTPQTDATYAVSIPARGGQCAAREELTVRVGSSGRSLAITPPQATICQGEAVTLNATGADQYQWTPTDGLDHPNSALVKASPDQTTRYTVLGISPGCTTRQEITVYVESPPTGFQVESEKARLCPGEQTLLRASGAASYTWSPAASLNQREGAEVIARPEVSTRYRVEAISPNGCQATQEIEIAVVPKPELSLIASKRISCPGEAVRILAQGAASYRWPSRPDLQPMGNSATAKPTEAVEYQVVGRSAEGCTDTSRIALDVYPRPELSLTASRQTLCPGDRTVLTASGGQDYVWYPAQKLKVYNNQPNQAEATLRSDQTFSVVATDERGCKAEASIDIEVADGLSDQPMADFSISSTSTCAGQAVQFTSRSKNAAQYSWSFEGGEPSSSFEPNPKVIFREEGLHDVRLTVRSCAGLQASKERQDYLLVTSPFDLKLNTDDVSVCYGAPFQLRASGGKNYSWSPARYLDQTTGSSVVARPEQTTTYTATATDAQGCQSQASVTLTVIGGEEQVGVTPFEPVICEGGQVDLQASGGVTYTWSPQRGLDRSFGATVTATPEQTTRYTVEIITVDGCTYRKPVTVTVRQSNALALTASADEICPGEAVTLEASGEGVFRWSPDARLSAATGPKINAYPRETTTFTVEGVDANGCRATAKRTVKVINQPALTVSAVDPSICRGTTTELLAKGEGPFQWSPTQGLLQRSGPSVTASPQRTTTYTVSAGEGRCRAEKRITVEVLEPTALTIEPESPSVCPGTTLELEATSGSRHRWSGPGLNTAFGSRIQVSPQQTTAYSVTGLDAQGCESKGSISVSVKEGDFLQVSSSASIYCLGQSQPVRLIAKGAATYRWEGNGLSGDSGAQVTATPDRKSTYRVLGEDAYGCRDTGTVTLDVGRIEPAFQMSTNRLDLARSLGVVDFSDQTPDGQEWLWDFGEGSRSREQNPVHVYDQVGTYTITMLVSDGVCQGRATQELVVENTSSLETLTSEGRFEVSAPGSDGIVQLSLLSPQEMFLRLRLLDAEGKQLALAALRLQEGPYRQQLDLSSFPKGTYYVQLLDGSGSVTREFQY